MKKVLLTIVLGFIALLVYLAIGGGHAMLTMHNPDSMDSVPADSAAASAVSAMAGHDHSSHGTAASHAAAEAAAGANHSSGAHAPIDISGESIKPGLEISVLRDSMSGWNLHITTTNFKFTPARVGTADVVGEGHAHVYVNGVKLGRVYSHWYHLPSLPKGTHHVEVTLNANGHGVYSIGDRPVSRKITIVER